MRYPLELLGIVFLRFPPLLRLWSAILVAVNAAALFFINTIYGQVALAAVGAGLVIMTAIYARLGFVRLLGVGHILWLGMLPWMLYQLPNIERGSWLFGWLVVLIAVDSISLVVDTIDVARFVRGERAPYYRWDRRESAAATAEL